MRLSDAGRLVQLTWEQLPHHYPRIDLDAFVIMPNHVHGIVMLNDWIDVDVAEGSLKFPRPFGRNRYGLPEIIRAFKTFSSRRINEFREMTGLPAWQRSFYEHVIRNDRALDAIRDYIEANPLSWAYDPENPEYNR